MTVLGAWLKQIIMIVLLAVFTDLLLPTKATQKYVRTVLGLAIIAAMLQPIVPLMKKDWADEVAASVSREFTSDSTSVGSNNFTIANYSQLLTQEKVSESDLQIANEILGAMPDSYRSYVQNIKVTGSPNHAQSLQVLVELKEGQIPLNTLRNWIAAYLNIPSNQITMSVKGGV